MELKQRIFKAIEDNKDVLYTRGDELYAIAEPGYCEFETGSYITNLLKKWQLPYEKLSYTGIRVKLGQGKPHICLLLDMDALPLSKKEGYIHSCGHSIQTAIGLNVIETLKDESLQGTLDVIFTPAEEMIQLDYRDSLIKQGLVRFPSGKQDMIYKGVFDEADCILSCHANGQTEYLFDLNSTLTGFLVLRASFEGAPSHAGFAPQLGKNSLHGAMLALSGIQYLKEHFDPKAGVNIQPVITEPGGSINIVPSLTRVESYVRALDKETLLDAATQVEQLFIHCGEALGLKVTVERRPGFLPLRQAKEVYQALHKNMLLLCKEEDILKNPISGASGDVGDLSQLLPTVQMGFSGIEGRFHSDHFTVKDPYNAYVRPVQILCGTVLDLMEQGFSGNEGYRERKQSYMQHWLQA